MPPDPNGPLVLLSLDGGGVRGICSVLMLREIMNRVAKREGIPKERIKPADYFHLIGGTSTGGLISLMLGRFRMTADDCLDQYRSLSQEVFGPKNIKSAFLTAGGLKERGRYKATTLEDIVKRLANHWLKDEEAPMKVDGMEIGMGRCFVLSAAKETVAHARYLRTYPVAKFELPNCLVWEAARATTAAPRLFKPMIISTANGSRTDYVDPGLGFNNPVKQVYEEAETVFGGDRKVRCILSLGTGLQDPAGITGDGKIWILEVINMLKEIVTDCERAHLNTYKRLQKHDKLYYRLNVISGGHKIELNEWEKVNVLERYTEAYMEETPGVSKQIDEIVDLILGKGQTRDLLSLSSIISTPSTIPDLSPVTLPPSECTSSHYIEHVNIGDQITNAFGSRSCLTGDGPIRTAMFYGLGGSGKTQACLKYFERDDTGFVHKFWINASDSTTLAQAYSKLADKAAIYDCTPSDNVQKTREKVVEWLEQQRSPWLLVLDNLHDNEDASLWYPRTGSGLVIITCRHNRKVLESEIHFPIMSLENATMLLKKTVAREWCDEKEKDAAESLVDDLGFLPLAIELAGKSIKTEKYKIEEYHKVWASTFNHGRHEGQRLYATIRISYNHLAKSAQVPSGAFEDPSDARNAFELLRLLSFFSPKGISESIFTRAWERWDKALAHSEASSSWEPNQPAIFIVQDNMRGNSATIKRNMRRALASLSDYSFLTFHGDDPPHQIDVNALIHRWIQDEEWEDRPQRKLEKSALWKIAASTLAMSISRGAEETDLSFHRSLMPHLDALFESSAGSAAPEGYIVEILSSCLPMPNQHEAASRFAWVCSLNGYFTKAQKLRLAIYQAVESRPTRDPSELAHACSLLADAWSDDGDKAAALKYREQALELDKESGISETACEPHLRHLRDLADSYRDFHRYEEAHKLRERICGIWKKFQPTGRAHIHAHRDLAMSFYDRRDYPKAMSILQKIVEIENNLVPQGQIDHEDGDRLISLSALARCYSANGYEKEAKDAYQEVFEARRGKPHHDLFVAMQDLANSYSKLGNEADAYELRQNIVKGFEYLGERISQKHPSLLAARFNLARSLLTWDKVDEALELHRKVLADRKALNQPDEYDLETVDSMLGVAFSYWRRALRKVRGVGEVRGVDEEAEVALQKGEAVARICQRKAASRNSPDIRQWFDRWNDVGKLQYELKKYDCAIDTHCSVLAALGRDFKEDDDDMLSTLSLLAQNLFRRKGPKDLEQAVVFFKDIIRLLREKLDVEEYGHPRLIDPYDWLARTLEKQGNKGNDYMAMYEEILAMRERFHGKEAGYTKAAAERLASEYRSRKLKKKAKKLERDYGID